MEFANLRCEVKAPTAVVTLDRPKVLNALNAASFAELDAVFTALAENEAVLAIVLTGGGERAFAAGADINELAGTTAETGRAFSLRGQQVMRKIETLGKPVIACIRGYALGGGLELAMCCTFRLAADDAKLGLPELKLGVIPGYGGTQRLPRLVGRGMALKMLLTGETIGAAEALRIGLVDEVVPAAELLQRGEALARAIAAQAPLAVTAALLMVDEGIDLPLDLALLREADTFGKLCGSEDKNEGARAFLDKRAAGWKGK
jgi:enoyl-CoA hydratase